MNARAALALLFFAAASLQCRKAATEKDDAAQRPAASGLRFTAERVELTLSAERAEVLGSYTFHNPGASPWHGRIGYPILVDEDQPPPEEILLDGKDKRAVRCRTPDSCAAVIELDLSAGSSRTIRIEYAQPITGRRAAYLLTSALRWKQPVARAEFAVRLPAAWTGVELSYPVEQDRVDGATRILEFSRRDFVPERELVVSWQR